MFTDAAHRLTSVELENSLVGLVTFFGDGALNIGAAQIITEAYNHWAILVVVVGMTGFEPASPD